jgi:acyl transferase domain-containing protein/3-hydroxymyristoyl/3-hydroxydecanoyl-(acyl carrier protein) dehydratase/1-acyl-sn-glycerol-3-phosphate acyltransferase
MPFSIAVVGRACVLPGALTPAALWEAVAEGRDLVGQVPDGRWGVDPGEVLCGPDAPEADRTWTDRGGYVHGFEAVWEAEGFGVPAAELDGLDTLAHWVLHTAREALRDAGDGRAGAVLRPRAGAVFGNLGFPSLGSASYARGIFTGEGGGDPRNRFMSGGTAALLARAFGLGAGSFCLDAACASSLYAVKLACDRLNDGEADLMLAGAVQAADDLFLHVGFSALNALSRSGRSRPFHRDADGLLPAEGAAFVVLKRLSDARRDGDTIHGVIRGVGLSNDGRGKGFLAPGEEGQERAIRAAYASAGLDPSRVSLLECHATGTPVGDATELKSTGAVFAGLEGVPIGSLKSNLGHLITVAGAAGLVKVMEAMRAGLRPPTLHADAPTDALGGSPFRLLHALEPWPSDGPRVAAVSAFGFGGNNAHLVVSENDPELDRICARGKAGRGSVARASADVQAPEESKAAAPIPVAIVGLGCSVARAADRAAFAEALFSGEPLLDDAGEGRMGPIELDIEGLRFPPRDLDRTLPQQLSTLGAGLEAVAETGPLPRETTGVFVGMEPDGEIGRWGTRWRLARTARENGAPDGWLSKARDGVAPRLEAATVVGTMPNIPANRLSSQLDLAGPGFTVQAAEASGTVALGLALRALRAGELDAALVGAADLCCEPVHRSAAEALLPEGSRTPGDAAVVLVLERLADAQRQGRRIYAVFDGSAAEGADAGDAGTCVKLGLAGGHESLVPRLGHAAAASALVHVAAAALGLHFRRLPDGRPWLPVAGRRAAEVRVREDAASIRLVEAAGHPPRSEGPSPRLRFWAGADRRAVAEALKAGREGLDGPARLVLVSHDEFFDEMQARALALLERGTPAGAGIHFSERPVSGGLAFVFTGAGAAYRGMGRDLVRGIPSLADALARKSPSLVLALDRVYADEGRELTVLEQLWGASALCQLHVELTRGVLGLSPDAWMGYSSGETNALIASGTWTDVDALVHESETSGLFTRELGGSFEAVARRWGGPVRWASWAVLAPVSEVEAALATVDRVHLAAVHGDADCVVAGDAAACEALVERLGRDRCLPLGYPLAVHVPELGEVREGWLALHRRDTTPPAGARLYSNARGGAYEPSREACAQAILGQADRTLDVRPAVLAAWQDGVRVFVEHGPRGVCGRFLRGVLGDCEALVVSLDRKGGGLEATLDAVAALLAAGLPVRYDALAALLPEAPRPPRPARTLSFAAHLPAVAIPPLEAGAARLGRATAGVMAPAPALPPVLDEDWRPRRQPDGPRSTPHSSGSPLPASHQTGSSLHVPPLSAPPALVPAASPVTAGFPPALPMAPPLEASPVLASFQAHVGQVARLHQDFVLSQQALHERFLSMMQAAEGSLLHAASAGEGSTSHPVLSPVSQGAISPGLLLVPPPAPIPVSSPLPAPAAVERVDAPPARPAEVPRAPAGPTFGRRELEIHAGGRISEIFGPRFAAQDGYERQVRMPLPPLLLADRVTGLDAEPASMGKGSIRTETDVREDSWYLHQGRMPPGVLIEAGQADLMLISYLGVDLLNRGERVYRLLGCELTYHGDLPRAGETLAFDIHLDGHAAQGDVRLMFFHYDCLKDGRPQLTVRKGQAGFFTDAELAASAGCLWSPEEQAVVESPRLDPPAVACERARFERADLEAFARGDAHACFGPGFERARTHTRSPRIQDGRMLLLDRVTAFDASGGPWGRGYLRAELDVRPDRWFFEGHFKNDPCMPGTLMFEACLQAMALHVAAMGFTLDRDGWRFQPEPEVPYQLQCRGQVTPASRLLVTEVFVEEVVAGPVPTLYADLLCTVDGLKAFHARRVALQLVPDWPLEAMPALVAAARSDARPAAEADGFRFDEASLLACAWGRPSHAFGPMYARFDGPTRVARLPGPPYLFMSRVVEVHGEMGGMKPGARAVVEYDVPDDAWYWDENGARTMPYAVLLEAALQPCGWLSSYVGCALSVEGELGFRNLDGAGTLHGEVRPGGGPLVTRVELKSIAASGSTIIVAFVVDCSQDGRPVYRLETVFGFFAAASLASQAGLPAREAEIDMLGRSSDSLVDLASRPAAFFSPDRPRLAGPTLLMIDRVDGFWPGAGAAGLGQMRAVKDVDPGEWFFKAHFFQDPVQPGSLGIEAMIQTLQAFMLETRMDEGIERPRFEPLEVGRELKWKYRGQVLPHHRTVHTTLEVTEAGRDERGAWAVATASLWADGQRIYEAQGLGMRIVAGDPLEPGRALRVPSADADLRGAGLVLDPSRDAWMRDHCPTYTLPALPMTVLVDLLARGSEGAGPVIGLRDVRVSGWCLANEPLRLRAESAGPATRLLSVPPDGEADSADAGRVVATARVLHGAWPERPAPWPPAEGESAPLPYESGALFHGPAFRVLERLVTAPGASSSVLSAASGVPHGLLNPALLDGATHGIPHDGLHAWDAAYDPGKVAYPVLIPEIDFFGPAPVVGTVRCEVRLRPFLGTPDHPVFAIQLTGDEGVWCQLRLVEACFPKGPIGSVAPLLRRAFLADRAPVPGLRLSRVEGGDTLLADADVAASDWLPGTVERVFGARRTGDVALREHVAAAHALHPGRVLAQLPLTAFDLAVTREGPGVRVSGDPLGRIDAAPVRAFWTRWFDRGPWPVEDLYYGLVERFLGRVFVESPEEFAALRGKSVLYLANHQTGVESLLFSIVASALNEVPTVTLAKIEHRTTWLGRLIRHSFSYPGVRDPLLMTFFDREDRSSLPRVIAELAAEMAGPGRSVLVHVEGTRSLSCRNRVEKMSGAFVDMALQVGVPIVPVRFVGGLPVEPAATRLEFPLGLGRQDIHLGRPLRPEELSGLHYGARKALVLDAINGLGVPNEREEPLPGDPAFATRVSAWREARGVSHEHATLREVLAGLASPGREVARLLAAKNAAELETDERPEGRWLAELGRWLLGRG